MVQQTGVPPIISSRQPALRQADTFAATLNMAMHPASPLVHVTTQPSLVISHLHYPIIMLQLQTIIFIMQQHEHMLPASMVKRFCIMARATASSHVHEIFMPPFMFSMVILQRGTIIMFGAMGEVGPGIGVVPIPGMAMPMPIPDRSIIIVPVIILTPWVNNPSRERTPG